ncbi:MAG: hypothetical protein NC338_03595 [Firmicutes bacterium]|nr:hypothetical protein [Bacillota bacterium]MCM1401345.1 hypothetical protein [Bacteroides sp.]MCM1477298.1 hypothetical protein [Bacteroides sp.]
MKKIYTLILSALCVSGASAASYQALSANKLDAQMMNQITLTKKASQQAATVKAAPEMSTMKAAIDDYVGEWEWLYSSLASQSAATGSCVVTAGDGNTLNFEFVAESGLKFTVEGTYFTFQGKVEIAQQSLGINIVDQNDAVIGEAYFYNIGANNDGFVINSTPITATYDETSNSFSLAGNICIGTLDFKGMLDIYQNNTMQVPVDWDSHNAKYFDGIFAPMYGITENQMVEFDVEVLENPANPGYFRMKNPLIEINGAACNIDVDATDPEYVLIPQTNTNYTDKSDGITYIISQSYAMANMVAPEKQLDKAGFLAQRGDYNITFDKAAGRITFPGNCCFFMWPKSSIPNNLYTAQAAFAGYLQFTDDNAGISDVTVGGDANAPVEYFNLQGVRVNNPENGQIVIRRQGNKVSKVYVK